MRQRLPDDEVLLINKRAAQIYTSAAGQRRVYQIVYSHHRCTRSVRPTAASGTAERQWQCVGVETEDRHCWRVEINSSMLLGRVALHRIQLALVRRRPALARPSGSSQRYYLVPRHVTDPRYDKLVQPTVGAANECIIQSTVRTHFSPDSITQTSTAGI